VLDIGAVEGELVNDVEDVVGTADGLMVGIEVIGISDGLMVGIEKIGISDGMMVGFNVVVGDSVGNAEGPGVGEGVGSVEGRLVGETVGFEVIGIELGDVLGAMEFCSVEIARFQEPAPSTVVRGVEQALSNKLHHPLLR